MKSSLISVALSGLVLALGGAGPEAGTEVQKFAPFVGEWTIRATWAGGNPLVARNVNAWTLNNTHLSGQTVVGEGDAAYVRYHTYMSYDAKHNCLVSTSFAMDGAVSSYRVETEDGKTFKLGFTPIGQEELPKVRQTIHFRTADAYQWIVELNQDGTWTQIMDGVWTRAQPGK